MKKIFILLFALLFMCNLTFAEEKAKPIYVEIESPSAITYYAHLVKTDANIRYVVNFVKYVDVNNKNYYWFRVNSGFKARLMYNLGLEIDGVTYQLLEIQNPTFSQIHSSAYSPEAIHCEFYNLYAVPNEVVEKIKTAKEPLTVFVSKQTRQNYRIKSKVDFTKAVQKIISLTYSDKDVYWKPNIKN